MLPTQQGAIGLFRFAGIRVYLHWTWFIVAAYVLSERSELYASFAWNVAEYLCLFLIVLLHEFGHSLACRQTGGLANQIVLWPLGGVAYVQPPPRPGAVLWSIAAGPLVNVLLWPILFFARQHVIAGLPTGETSIELARFIDGLFQINTVIQIFNMLPIYPLDGGQILRALLWFGIGPVRSLYIAALIGFAGVAGVALLAWNVQSLWLGILAFFIASMCWSAFQQARYMLRVERQPPPPPV